jgi:hypothetical protein
MHLSRNLGATFAQNLLSIKFFREFFCQIGQIFAQNLKNLPQPNAATPEKCFPPGHPIDLSTPNKFYAFLDWRISIFEIFTMSANVQ